MKTKADAQGNGLLASLLQPGSKTIRVLLIEDSETDSLLIRSDLEVSLAAVVVGASRMSEGLQQVGKETFDVILLDLNLPDSTGKGTFDAVYRAVPNVPVIVLTGVRDSDIAREVLRRGAQDYLLKDTNMAPLLVRSIVNAIDRQRLVAERDAHARQLEDSEAGIRAIIEANADAIVIVDREGVIRFVNPMAEQMFARSKTDLIGQSFGFPTGKDQVIELDIRRRDGTTGIAEMRIVELMWGGCPAFLASLRDITEHKRIQEEIIRLNTDLESRVRERTVQFEAANKELDAFCHSVSHDLRAPVRHIVGFTDILNRDHRKLLDENGRECLDHICEATKRMGELIEDMLNLSRVTRADLTRRPVNLSATARRVAKQLQDENPDRQVELVIADSMAIEGDARLLLIVLENLLGNAWKFTSKKPHARIEVGMTTGDGGQRVCFVRDNGAGFNMQFGGRLFGTFQRMHKQDDFPGTGVGLATVQRIIHRHGGRIWAQAAVNEGATFFFTLEPGEQAEGIRSNNKSVRRNHA